MIKALKRFVLAACIGVMSFSSYAQSESDTQPKKVLNVGCEGAFAPFTYINDQGDITGFDIDLIKELGTHLGYDVKINVMAFDGLIPSLMVGNIDLIISGFTITDERAKKVDFSDPYYLCGMSYVLNKKDVKKYDSYEKLNGHTLCTQLAATGTNFSQKFLPKSQLKIFNAPPETYIELGNGSCVAAVHDKPVNDFFLARDTSGKFTSIEITKHINKEYYGIAVQKGNKKLLDEINRVDLSRLFGELFSALLSKFGKYKSYNRTVIAGGNSKI